jgi:hypothetical protein
VSDVKNTLLVAVNCEVEALVKFCAAVHQLPCARLRSAESEAPRDAGEPETVRVPLGVERPIVESVRPLLLRVPERVFANVKVPAELEMMCPSVRPLKERADDVANVSAPVCPDPYVCVMEVNAAVGERPA